MYLFSSCRSLTCDRRYCCHVVPSRTIISLSLTCPERVALIVCLIQGFVKRDRKCAAKSMTPEVPDGSRAQTHGDSKRSTEWTLTDDAIAGGIQSTTRYRNKKNDGREARARQAHLGFCPPAAAGRSSSSSRYGFVANSRIGPLTRGRQHPARISKAHRLNTQLPQHHLRLVGDASAGFLSRTSSPAMGSYSQGNHHETMLASGERTSPPIKLEPDMPYLAQSQAQDPYGMVLTEQTPSLMSSDSGPVSSSLYMSGTPQDTPSHGTFPYHANELHMMYHGLDGGANNMPGAIYDFTGHQGY